MAAVAAVGLVISALSAGYAAYSAHETANFNEKVAEREAKYQEQKGKAEADQHRRRVAKVMGAAKVGAATSGVSLMSGSVQDIFEDSYEDAAFDEIMILSGAKNAANASLLAAEGYKREGQNATIAGVANVGSTLLTSNYKKAA